MPHRRPVTSASAEILVVEDDDVLRDVLTDALRDAGHSVNSAANGKDALALLAGNRLAPNLVILDLNLPVVNGWELLEIMRSYKRLVDIPVIVMTGVTADEARRAAGEAAVTVLRKPFDLDGLLATVEAELRAHGHP